MKHLLTYLLVAITVALTGIAPAWALDTSAATTISAPLALQQAQAGKLVIVDVRTPQEWRQTGVAPGVKRVDVHRPDFVPALLAAVGGDKHAPIALVCRSGNRSKAAQATLREAGFTRVVDISEGMSGGARGPGWIPRGLPVQPCPSC